jgi:hypothetical protein
MGTGGSSPGVKRQGLEAGHSPPSRWELYSQSPIRFHGMVFKYLSTWTTTHLPYLSPVKQNTLVRETWETSVFSCSRAASWKSVCIRKLLRSAICIQAFSFHGYQVPSCYEMLLMQPPSLRLKLIRTKRLELEAPKLLFQICHSENYSFAVIVHNGSENLLSDMKQHFRLRTPKLVSITQVLDNFRAWH